MGVEARYDEQKIQQFKYLINTSFFLLRLGSSKHVAQEVSW